MKKVAFIIAALLAFTLMGCSEKPVDETVEEKPKVEESTKESKYVKLKGRGNADNGREEPEYEGLLGFIVSDESFSDDQFPESPWHVNAIKPTEPNKFEKTNETIPHKTEVKVLEQHLEHDRYGRYNGYLVVESVEDKKKYNIDVKNFVTFPYWEEELTEAVKQGNIIAEYNGKGEKPIDRDGEWVELDAGIKVLVTSMAGAGKPDGFVKAKVYKQWKHGYGGVDVYFNSKSLNIIY